MGGSWFAYVIVFAGALLFLLLIGGTTLFLYAVARRRGELGPHRVKVVGLSGGGEPGADGG